MHLGIQHSIEKPAIPRGFSLIETVEEALLQRNVEQSPGCLSNT